MSTIKPFRLAFSCAIIAVLASASFAESPNLVAPGRWEITLQNELPSRTDPVTYSMCIDPGSAAHHPAPPKTKPSDPCQVRNGGVSGNVLSYEMQCGTERSSTVQITYYGVRYEGVVEAIDGGTKVRQIITARRVGKCDDEQSSTQ